MNRKTKMILLQAVKIGVGSSLAIYLAELLGLQYATSAGTIALLTVVTTRWETFRVSILRVVTFVMAVALSWLTLTYMRSEWVAYGIYIFLIVFICEYMGWKATISVNSVIGAHFLTTRDFSLTFIANEFCLILIGISVAILVNIFHNKRGREKRLVQDIHYTEDMMRDNFEKLARYLHNEPLPRSVWDDVIRLEKEVQGFLDDAYVFKDNNFRRHAEYYTEYFEMRLLQCGVLHNLHYQLRQIREMPVQAGMIADFMQYLGNNIYNTEAPQEQIDRLDGVFGAMKKEPLPVSREEFEARAILYHVLMELEKFVVYKKRFVQGLTEEKKKIYHESREQNG